MSRLRALFLRHHSLALLLVVCALAMRALVPAGYMIGGNGRSITVYVCSGLDTHNQTVTIPTNAPTDDGAGNHGSKSPCAFAALDHAGAAGSDPILLAAALIFILALGVAATAPLHLRRLGQLRPPLRGPPFPV